LLVHTLTLEGAKCFPANRKAADGWLFVLAHELLPSVTEPRGPISRIREEAYEVFTEASEKGKDALEGEKA
jgi:hypothetical protein